MNNGIHLHGMHRVEGPEQALRSGALGWAVPSMILDSKLCHGPWNTHTQWFLLIWHLQSREGSAKKDLDVITFGLLYHGMSHSHVHAACQITLRSQKCLKTPTQQSPTHAAAEHATPRSRPKSAGTHSGAVGAVSRHGEWARLSFNFCTQITTRGEKKKKKKKAKEKRCSQQVAIFRACKCLLLQSRCPEIRAQTSMSCKLHAGREYKQMRVLQHYWTVIFLRGCCYKGPSIYLISFSSKRLSERLVSNFLEGQQREGKQIVNSRITPTIWMCLT